MVMKFNEMSAKAQRITLTTAGLVIVVGVSWVITEITNGKQSRTPRAEKPEVTVVAPVRVTGVETFEARMSMMNRQQEENRRQLGKIEERLKEKQKKEPQFDDDAQASNLTSDADFDATDQALPEPPTANTVVFDAPVKRGIDLPLPQPAPDVAAAPVASHSSDLAQVQPSAPPVPPAPPPPVIRVTMRGANGESVDAEKYFQQEAAQKNTKTAATAFIPGGSMTTGVLLTGLDAPTSSVAQKHPTPVVIRIKREAVLPNYASLDLRECFVMASGYGQLSSERVIMRAESISCVREDGKVFETALEAYITGTDGKVGIPGRLVSKQGQIIAQALIAGTLSGVGSTLQQSKVPTLNLNPASGGTAVYENESTSAMTQSGLSGGISSAANLIAKFYLDMAKETFPVVEVPAGEAVTVTVTRGVQLPMRGSTELQKLDEKNFIPSSSPQTRAINVSTGSAQNTAAQVATAGNAVTQAPMRQAQQPQQTGLSW